MRVNNPSLLGAMLTASYLTRISNRRPNPTPTTSTTSSSNGDDNNEPTKDFLRYVIFIPNLREWIIIVLQTAHIILTSQYPPSTSLLCPQPALLNPRYFTWNTYTASWLTILVAAASIRLAAFRELGKNFTFELARPAKLITTGMYAYVQHPSYPTDFTVTCANLLLFGNPDGWVGSLLPTSVQQTWLRYKWASYGAFVVLGFGIFSTRVRQEEAMLRKAYGKEWEEWHRKTARFIPGIF